jgi:hypothetical protein
MEQVLQLLLRFERDSLVGCIDGAVSARTEEAGNNVNLVIEVGSLTMLVQQVPSSIYFSESTLFKSRLLFEAREGSLMNGCVQCTNVPQRILIWSS